VTGASSHAAVASARSGKYTERPLAILAVEEVAHRSSPSFVRFLQGFAFVGVHALLRYGAGAFGFAARWAAVGKAGFVRLQLELF